MRSGRRPASARELRLRGVVEREAPQALPLERLGVRLPRRLVGQRSDVIAAVQ